MSPSPLSSWSEPLGSVLLVLGLLTACANPVAPTGGPPDQTPPAIVETMPEANEVNVATDTDRIRLTFDEYIDHNSFAQAVSVTPPLDGSLRFNWSGRRVDIVLPEPLRENTTYILTIDTDMQNVRNVSIEEPLQLAFSTGPTINRGQLSGRVVTARRGLPAENYDVFAYAAPDSLPPDSLPERPAYRTQTNQDGQFSFEYLREQPYYVVAVQDRNRNRQADPLEPFAVPSRPVLYADSTGLDETLTWVAAPRDTISPRLGRTRAPSNDRVVLRFDEPVQLTERDVSRWHLEDSLRQTRRTIQHLYQRSGNPAEVHLRTEPLEASAHRLTMPRGAVIDSTGTPAEAQTGHFVPPEERSPEPTRFEAFTPANRSQTDDGAFVLFPDDDPGLRFNQPIDSARLQTLVVVEDSLGQPRAFTTATDDGTTYRLRLDPELQPSEQVELRVDGQRLDPPEDTTYARTFQHISTRALGELSGYVALPDTNGRVVVELHPTGDLPLAPRTTTADEDGHFFFGELPEAEFRFRAFLDRNDDGSWDPGQILPFQAAEPITWSTETVRVRPRWETEIAETLQF